MTETTVGAEDGAKKRRPRGTGFPSMPLSDAAAAITTIASMGKHLTKEEAASYLGHSTVNSGAFAVKYAALRDYGFLTGRGDQLEVGDLGMQVAHPDSDSSRDESLRQAFFRSEIFGAVFSSLHPGTDLQKDHVASKAVHQFGVSPSSKSAFIENFVESAAAAGLVEKLDEERFRVLAEASEAPETPFRDDERSIPPERVPPASSPPRDQNRAGQAPVVSHPWRLSNGEMLFQITVTGSLPATAYGKIQSIIEQGDELARLLGLEDQPAGPADAPDEEVMS